MASSGSEGRNGRRSHIHSPEYDALRKALAEGMQAKGIGQRELSRKLGKPSVYVNRILGARRTIEFGEFIELCDGIGIDPANILEAAMRDAGRR